jgi:alginate O-acetyltransferase complex protein AlgI
LKGVSRILFGIGLLYLSLKLQEARLPVFFLSEFVALVGLSFILHFGVLNVSTAFWRWLGVDVGEIFRAPYKAKSLPEFWSRRWNNAFTEMTQTIAFRPLVSAFGGQRALLVGFLLSGVLHEIAISLPVASGYGLPTLYFVWQSLLMLAEKKYQFLKNITQNFWLGRLWTFCWIALPLPLLFHARFIEQVVYPLRAIVLFVLL